MLACCGRPAAAAFCDRFPYIVPRYARETIAEIRSLGVALATAIIGQAGSSAAGAGAVCYDWQFLGVAPKWGARPGSIGVSRPMLQSIRDGLGRHKWLQFTLLGALALVFAAWGAYGFVNLNVGATSYAAEAGGEKISLQQARNAWLRMQQRFG